MDIGNIMSEVGADLKERSLVAEGDYIKDGIVYCGKCNEPKASVKRNSRGEELYIPMSCKCSKGIKSAQTMTNEELVRKFQKNIKRHEEEMERDRLIRIDQNKRRAFDDIRLREWTFDKDDKTNAKISSVAEKYADNFHTMKDRGKGLLLYGGVGTGKSFIAACIANAVLEQDYKVKFTNFSRLANSLVACEFGEKQEYIDSLNRYSLLIIDDLGSERDTEFMSEVVYSVIDSRHKSGLPLIVTTNLTGDELKHPKDIHSERVFSRLFEMCIPVEVKGTDRRKLKLRDADKDLKELLGLTNAD